MMLVFAAVDNKESFLLFKFCFYFQFFSLIIFVFLSKYFVIIFLFFQYVQVNKIHILLRLQAPAFKPGSFHFRFAVNLTFC